MNDARELGDLGSLMKSGESGFGLEDFLGVGLHLGFGDHLLEDAILVDDESGAVGAVEFATHEFFGSPNPVRVMHAQLLVAQQVKLQAELVNELLMRLGGVLADAEDLVASVGERVKIFVEVAGLGRAAWRVVLGVEVEDEFGTLEFVEGAHVAVLVWGGERGSLVAGVQRRNRLGHTSKNMRMPARFAGSAS